MNTERNLVILPNKKTQKNPLSNSKLTANCQISTQRVRKSQMESLKYIENIGFFIIYDVRVTRRSIKRYTTSNLMLLRLLVCTATVCVQVVAEIKSYKNWSTGAALKRHAK